MSLPGVEILGWVASAGAAAAAVGYGVRKVVGGLRRLGRFFDDWEGIPARPGVEARPGVMQRLDSIESSLGVVESRLGVVETRLDGVETEVRNTTPPVTINMPTSLNQHHKEDG